MAWYTDLFTVETYTACLASARTVSGYKPDSREASMARRLRPGDRLLGYVLGLSRWVSVREIVDGPFTDTTPLFVPQDDPWTLRFHVNPLVVLLLEHGVPIRERQVFETLSFTRGRENGYWLGPLRRSLQHIDDADGRFLENLLLQQAESPHMYPLSQSEIDAQRRRHVRRAEGLIAVTVPADEPEEPPASPMPPVSPALPASSSRESIRIQADLARLGEQMGFHIWLPKNDRPGVLTHWQPGEGVLLSTLPLNYDGITLRTIEQIDVLWLKGRAIRRAFEVEHTTAIYSGLLRMADLLALQPNMNIRLHIVASVERREKVLEEISRPVFALLENHPLAERCSYIAYEDLREIMTLKHLGHTSDSVIGEYEEWAGGGGVTVALLP